MFISVSVIGEPVPEPITFEIPVTTARVQVKIGVGVVLLVML